MNKCGQLWIAITARFFALPTNPSHHRSPGISRIVVGQRASGLTASPSNQARRPLLLHGWSTTELYSYTNPFIAAYRHEYSIDVKRHSPIDTFRFHTSAPSRRHRTELTERWLAVKANKQQPAWTAVQSLESQRPRHHHQPNGKSYHRKHNAVAVAADECVYIMPLATGDKDGTTSNNVDDAVAAAA